MNHEHHHGTSGPTRSSARDAWRSTRRRLVWAVCASALCVCGCRSKEGKAEPGVLVDERTHGAGRVVGAPGQDPARLGEMARAPHFTMVFTRTKKCTVAPPFRPPHGTMKLGVEVTISGTSKLEVPVNPFYASLETPDGTRYTSTLAGCEPVLEPVRVTDGKHVEGWITFDVPQDHKPLTMIYAPTLIGAGVEEVRFQLE